MTKSKRYKMIKMICEKSRNEKPHKETPPTEKDINEELMLLNYNFGRPPNKLILCQKMSP